MNRHFASTLAPGTRLVVAIAPGFTIGFVRPSGLRSIASIELNGRPVLFAPSLSVGAGIGQLVATLLPDMNRQAVMLLVMGAYFSGVVHSPVTAAVILFEMTAAHMMLLPLVLATVLAYEASRLVCPVSLYEQLAESFLKRERGIVDTVNR